MSWHPAADYGGSMSLKDIQLALKTYGYDVGTIGSWNSKTKAAVSQFQSEKKLPVTGIPGPETQAVLQTMMKTYPVDLSQKTGGDSWLDKVLGTAGSIISGYVGSKVSPQETYRPPAQATLFGLPVWLVLGGGVVATVLLLQKGKKRR